MGSKAVTVVAQKLWLDGFPTKPASQFIIIGWVLSDGPEIFSHGVSERVLMSVLVEGEGIIQE